MAAEGASHVLLYGLQVDDSQSYARYREHMTPILKRYGGNFGCDFSVSHVWKSPAQRPINRVFSMLFPSGDAAREFFADPAYLEVRRAHFEGSVSAITELGAFEEAQTRR
jgi:uncharacterized protein (DUF1330 family)